MYTVYKHLDEDENILYIGKSKSLLYRQRQHKKNAEWFEEVDSIEYCTFSSKSEMDLVEVYLINTLNPKYNKKDKRDDIFTSLKLDELNWLQFDMCEIEIRDSNKPIKEDTYEDFVLENIKSATHISLITENSRLEAIKSINYENKLVMTKNENIYNFKDLVLYSVSDLICQGGCIDNAYVIASMLLNTENKNIVSHSKATNKGYQIGTTFYADIRWCEKLIPTKKDVWISNLKWENL